MKNRIGIVGGGAAGMTAAITAATRGAEVTIIEGNDRLGKKLLSTGNGKCNLGNEKLNPEQYYAGDRKLLDKCLRRFKTEDTISFFQSMGLLVKSRNGYLYPYCEQASAVLDVLRYQVAALGIKVVTECKIEEIRLGKAGAKSGIRDNKACAEAGVSEKSLEKGGTEGVILRGRGQTFAFDKVVLACGGCAAPKTGSDGSGFRLAEMVGHTIVPTVPALVQLRCRENYLKSVAGVRADALLTVFHRGEAVAAERGELLLTDYGISGIPVFQISRVVNYLLAREKQIRVVINLMPDCADVAFDSFLTERMGFLGDRTVEEFFTGMLHKKLMLLFIRLAELKPAEKVGSADRRKLRRIYELCRHWEVHANGSNSYDNAQVCAGGVSLDEVTENLESKKAGGIYFAGEILDVDGKCGGYNLQWAWCSGFLTGKAAAEQSRRCSEAYGR